MISLQPREIARGFCASLAALLLLIVACAAAPTAQGQTLGTLSVAPTGANLGSVAIGSKSSQVLQLKNTGTSTMTLSAGTVTGAGFTISNLYLPLWLGPGVTFNVTVTFTPTTTGTRTGAVTIKSSSSNPSLTIPISGTGVTATRTLSLSATSLNFGSELVGGSEMQTVAVKNSGNASVTVSGIAVSGTGFSTSGGVSGATIAAGQTAELSVGFLPKSTGTFNGSVTISSNATNSPEHIAIAGTGVSSGSHSVSLHWNASTTIGVLGYNVYRSTSSGGSYSRISSTLLTSLSYTDTAVTAGETYYYVVTAVTLLGAESTHSAQAEATIP